MSTSIAIQLHNSRSSDAMSLASDIVMPGVTSADTVLVADVAVVAASAEAVVASNATSSEAVKGNDGVSFEFCIAFLDNG